MSAELEVYLGHGWAEKMDRITKDDLEAVGRNVANKKVSAVTHREYLLSSACSSPAICKLARKQWISRKAPGCMHLV